MRKDLQKAEVCKLSQSRVYSLSFSQDAGEIAKQSRIEKWKVYQDVKILRSSCYEVFYIIGLVLLQCTKRWRGKRLGEAKTRARTLVPMVLSDPRMVLTGVGSGKTQNLLWAAVGERFSIWGMNRQWPRNCRSS